MSSTAIKFWNRADVPVLVKEKFWGVINESVTVQPGGEADIADEYVWYDIYVYDLGGATQLASRTSVYGNSSVVLTGSNGKYALR
jgi:hypothetical protein